MKEDLPPEEEGDILIRGTYTTRSGQEVPVEIHTNRHGMIYRHWRAELEARGGGIQKLEEGEIYHFQKQAPAEGVPDNKGRTLIEVFAEEKAKDLAQIQGRLNELRASLKLANPADEVYQEILALEKKLLGDP